MNYERLKSRLIDEQYKFKFWFRISKGYFAWYKVVKFRGANHVDLHLLGLKLNWGMPYLHNFIFEQGYNAGFRGNQSASNFTGSENKRY